ncbi:MAG: exodeoxyribonuclease III [Nitrospirae bacterium]|nr:exodeoxyribonuclease III [Nitrospirota bacterium]
MVVCTFNVNSVRVRMPLLAEWLKRREGAAIPAEGLATPADGSAIPADESVIPVQGGIDVLCLQEIKTVDEGFPFADFEALGYKCEVYGQKAYNGLAVCSRIPLTDVVKGFGDDRWDAQKRIMSATAGGYRLINVYAPHGDARGTEKFQYKLKWFDRLLAYATETAGHYAKTIILGDFNVAMADADVYDPEVYRDAVSCMPEEREAFARLIDAGFADTVKHLYPDKTEFTWWPYTGGDFWKDKGMRIDYVTATREALSGLKKAGIDRWPRKKKQPSDHAPLIAAFE